MSDNEEKLTITNPNSYAPTEKEYTPHSKITLSVEAILDTVPGAFYDPEDLMNWINSNPYVRSVTLESNSRDDKTVVEEVSVKELLDELLADDDSSVDVYDVNVEQSEAVDRDIRSESGDDVLTLEAGSTYLNGQGIKVKILHTEPHDSDQHEGLQYIGDDDWSYNVNGRWSWEEGKTSSLDLVSLYVEPDSILETAMPPLEMVEDTPVFVEADPSLPEGWTPWGGRRPAPSDYINGPVYTREGEVIKPDRRLSPAQWTWDDYEHAFGTVPDDIIGYLPGYVKSWEFGEEAPSDWKEGNLVLWNDNTIWSQGLSTKSGGWNKPFPDAECSSIVAYVSTDEPTR